ncbi:MAG: ABC-2 transporter permease [Oscillospiraceae bacterium]|nr:ABC-2 transporter permease [Oscillospiraceae bacterium]
MQGTVYKELVQNRFFVLFGLFLPPLVYIAVILLELIVRAGEAGLSWKQFFSEFLADGTLFPNKILILLIAYIGMRLLSASVFSADESKCKCFLMASVPEGTARQMYGKYVILFMTYALFFVSAFFTDSVLSYIVFSLTGEAPPSMLGLFALMLFLQLFLRSIDIPFMVSYGTKNGKYVFMIVLIAAMLAFAILILYSPSSENLIRIVADVILKLLNGELADETAFCISAFPIVSIAAYLVSYRISCKLWLKGAVNYEA